MEILWHTKLFGTAYLKPNNLIFENIFIASKAENIAILIALFLFLKLLIYLHGTELQLLALIFSFMKLTFSNSALKASWFSRRFINLYLTLHKEVSLKDFFSECEGIHNYIQICLHILQISLKNNFVYGAA